jgi:hypothetical protein
MQICILGLVILYAEHPPGRRKYKSIRQEVRLILILSGQILIRLTISILTLATGRHNLPDWGLRDWEKVNQQDRETESAAEEGGKDRQVRYI